MKNIYLNIVENSIEFSTILRYIFPENAIAFFEKLCSLSVDRLAWPLMITSGHTVYQIMNHQLPLFSTNFSHSVSFIYHWWCYLWIIRHMWRSNKIS
jgi:hypothetical protein